MRATPDHDGACEPCTKCLRGLAERLHRGAMLKVLERDADLAMIFEKTSNDACANTRKLMNERKPLTDEEQPDTLPEGIGSSEVLIRALIRRVGGSAAFTPDELRRAANEDLVERWDGHSLRLVLR